MNATNNTAETTDTLVTEEKAQSPWMIGLLVMIFGMMGLAINILNLYLGISDIGNVRTSWTGLGLGLNYVYFTLVTGLIVSIWMTYIGFRLLGYKDNGRRQFNLYIIYYIVWTLGTAFYQYLQMPDSFTFQIIVDEMMPGLLGKGAILALFLLCRYLINKPSTRAWLD